ncbi:MAG: VOC family protein [Blastocatellia bacterium]
MLNTIRAVTICAPDLKAIETAYETWLQYKTIARGTVSAPLAALWRTPRMMGREMLLMQPSSGEPVFLRFVAAEKEPEFAPMRTTGWNAMEILVRDPEKIARDLAGSPFTILGPTRGNSSHENISAIHVLGPARELLYLTRIPENEPAFNLGSARTEVDRVFIVVVGGRDLPAIRNFYADRLKMTVTDPIDVRISVLSNAYGLAPEHLHRLAIARFPERFLIEIDEYPASAADRPVRPGELPPGMAAVSFGARSLDGFAEQSIELTEPPYDGRRAALIIGTAGEMIELIEKA